MPLRAAEIFFRSDRSADGSRLGRGASAPPSRARRQRNSGLGGRAILDRGRAGSRFGLLLPRAQEDPSSRGVQAHFRRGSRALPRAVERVSSARLPGGGPGAPGEQSVAPRQDRDDPERPGPGSPPPGGKRSAARERPASYGRRFPGCAGRRRSRRLEGRRRGAQTLHAPVRPTGAFQEGSAGDPQGGFARETPRGPLGDARSRGPPFEGRFGARSLSGPSARSRDGLPDGPGVPLVERDSPGLGDSDSRRESCRFPGARRGARGDAPARDSRGRCRGRRPAISRDGSSRRRAVQRGRARTRRDDVRAGRTDRRREESRPDPRRPRSPFDARVARSGQAPGVRRGRESAGRFFARCSCFFRRFLPKASSRSWRSRTGGNDAGCS